MQKVLIGSFMGGLKPKISEGIKMFKPRTLKEAINLAKMRDEQLFRQQWFAWPQFQSPRQIVLPSPTKGSVVPPVKGLSWEEMQHLEHKGCALIAMNVSL